MAFEKWLNGWGLRLTTSLIKMLKAIYEKERITKQQMANVIGQSKNCPRRKTDENIMSGKVGGKSA
jgi:hypothetical protein